MFIFISLLCVLVKEATAFGAGSQVCYPSLGCFSTKSPWFSLRRPVPPPQSPSLLDIRAYFYSRDDPQRAIIVQTWPNVNLNSIPFDPKKMTFFCTHGFQNGGDEPWLANLKNALLRRIDSNVFIGDWQRGSKVISYFQGVANLRVASAEFVNLINYLVEWRGLDIKKLHIMGHSLGGQVCGQIGKAIPGIYRITAFDASQPMFEGEDEIVRLTKHDAIHVDAVHADARPFVPDIGFGAMNRVADIDFYMNAGHNQPGCSFPKVVEIPNIESLVDFLYVPTELFKETLLCPHGLSHDFWIEAINNTECVLWGYDLSWTNMIKGVSNAKTDGFFSKYLATTDTCTYGTCSPMGLEAFDWPARGAFVVATRGFSPFCLYEASIIPEFGQAQFLHRIIHAIVAIIYNETSFKETGTHDPGDYDDGDFDPNNAL